jgi:hypothetical protein
MRRMADLNKTLAANSRRPVIAPEGEGAAP